jgi:hypothetical protein
VLALLLALSTSTTAVPRLVDTYVDRYFQTFPSRATEAGRHDLDRQIEDLTPERLTAWIAFNRETRAALSVALARPGLAFEDRLDAETLQAQSERELHDLERLDRPRRDPLFWTGLVANATVFLLVRDELPLDERLASARVRAGLLPRLARQARAALEKAEPEELAAERCRIAAGQARDSARFYAEGFPLARGAPDPALKRAGADASAALEELASFLEALAARATGSARLGSAYAETFRVGTGVSERVEDVLARAERDLVSRRTESAVYGRSVWPNLFPAEPAPATDDDVLRRLFARVAEDRDRDLDSYTEGWRRNARKLESFVHERRLMALPEPLTLVIAPSPAYFVGQSVGGVYPAGPWAPEAKTLLFLPVPAPGASESERDAFFRDFNRPFNRMIAAHELIPGHYVQLKWAARHPHKVRALFPDPVYVEGWGTLAERLLLDEGWGGPLERLAHLKKQLENIARTIVDVRVHTRGMTREEVLRFVREEALQEEQFAGNMWTRTLTTAPQLTTYYLGYRETTEVLEAARRSRGSAFTLREFLDGMMQLGPVPLRHYLRRLAGKAPAE